MAFDSEVNWRITSFTERWRIQSLGVEVFDRPPASALSTSAGGGLRGAGVGVCVRGCGPDRSIADVQRGHKSLALNHLDYQTVYRRCWSSVCRSCRGFSRELISPVNHLAFSPVLPPVIQTGQKGSLMNFRQILSVRD